MAGEVEAIVELDRLEMEQLTRYITENSDRLPYGVRLTEATGPGWRAIAVEAIGIQIPTRLVLRGEDAAHRWAGKA